MTDAPVEMEDCTCPMGCPRGEQPVLAGRDRIHNLPGRFAIVRCSTCGFMRTQPRPTPKAIGFYYPDSYGPYLSTQVTPNAAKPRGDFDARRRWVAKWLDSRMMYLPELPPGRLLEMGCASGLFLEQMAQRGWHVEGVEPSAKAAEAARALGYSVHTGSMEDAPEPRQPFDLAVGWMVLEHLHDPLSVLKKLASWTTPEARLVFSIPNAASLGFRLFGHRWYALHLPNHLSHFTPATIRALLRKAGWEVTDIHYQRVITDGLASAGYVLQDLGLRKLGGFLARLPTIPGRWNYLLFPCAWLASLLRQTGYMTIWARKGPSAPS